jgi:hypothetical protein
MRIVSSKSIASGLKSLAVIALAACCLGICSTPALAVTEGPGWELSAHTLPTNIAPRGKGVINVEIYNVGAAASQGTVTFTDRLPQGYTATEAGALTNEYRSVENGLQPTIHPGLWDCTGNGQGAAPRVAGATVVTCTNDPENLAEIAGGGGEPNRGLGTHLEPEIGIGVTAPASEGSGANSVSVVGGGAPTSASTSDAVTTESAQAAFGFANFHVWASNADGKLDTQAGSHPYAVTFNYDLTTALKVNSAGETQLATAGDEQRNVEVKLPPGLVADPYSVPRCGLAQYEAEKCPQASLIGTLRTTFEGFPGEYEVGIYDIVPSANEPARLAATVKKINIFFDTSVRSGSDYGITTTIPNSPQLQIVAVTVTIWGNPADPSHNLWRDGNVGGCQPSEECFSPPNFKKPFFTLPTACESAQGSSEAPEDPMFTISATRWLHPELAPVEATTSMSDSNGLSADLGGCEFLPFSPTISTAPDTAKADTPAGLTVEVTPPVDGLSDMESLSSADIENTTVTLPEGVVVNPGQAAGLQACRETEATLKENNEAPVCPPASKVGTDEIETPLLAKPLQGSVYILQSNPPNLRILVAASAEGVNLKLIGDVQLDATTGRLTTTFTHTPELPFTRFRLSFSGGAQAALATPTTCGTYTTTSDFTAWGSPFVADAFPTSSFTIASGADGAPCPSSPLPFSPSLTAGSTTDQAGGYTDFSLLLQAPDDQQRIEKLQFKVPEGLLGMISKVPLCPEPQAANGTCSSASQIGHTVVASGPGPYPLVIPQPGQPPAAIYLTGSYEGAPYGLSIVVPVVAGPFTLQTQIVRAKIEIDPLTAQITVTTDPLPQVIDGIPTDLRTVNAVIDRPGFMFNPTSCEPMTFAGTAYSAQGASVPIGSPFQMGSCRSLTFKPDFKVSTSGKTSRKNGASLDVKLLYPTVPLEHNQASTQSNIASVKVDLPKQLPSRLSTLQKACTIQTFTVNPAACPAESRVGNVTAITPVLPVALTGPAYFVSNAGLKFPELIFVLQGYGVTVDLHAETFISPAGITSSTLHRVPDVPITSFELKLPEGPYSALGANANLCKVKGGLKMPTAFVGQNGATIHQTTPISVSGCAKAKPKKAKQKTRKGHKKK